MHIDIIRRVDDGVLPMLFCRTVYLDQAADVNHDGLVSFEEFNSLAKRQPDLIPYVTALVV